VPKKSGTEILPKPVNVMEKYFQLKLELKPPVEVNFCRGIFKTFLIGVIN